MTKTRMLIGRKGRMHQFKDMMEYVARKDYLHFFYMGFTVQETGHYTVHKLMREAVLLATEELDREWRYR